LFERLWEVTESETYDQLKSLEDLKGMTQKSWLKFLAMFTRVLVSSLQQE
jgi:hypothetical protein